MRLWRLYVFFFGYFLNNSAVRRSELRLTFVFFALAELSDAEAEAIHFYSLESGHAQ